MASWEDIVRRKRAIQAAAIAPYLEQEIPTTDSITDIDDVDVLAELMRKGDLAAEEVIISYIKRQIVSLTNHLFFILYHCIIADNFYLRSRAAAAHKTVSQAHYDSRIQKAQVIKLT